MSGAIELRWIVSFSASAVHAGDLARRGLALDSPLVEAAAQPAEWLGAALRGAGLDEDAFWDQLLPLSAEIENNRQLVEAVLRKRVAAKDRGASLAARLAGCVADLEAAVARFAPGLVGEIGPRAERLRAAWDERGEGLLERVGLLTDARTVAAGAKVAALWPVAGDYGAAHLAANVVRMEMAAEDTCVLPAMVRLGWLLAQLNLDLPVFSEEIPAARRGRLAGLAMLPVTLGVAEELGMVGAGEVSLARAIEACRCGSVGDAEAVERWWASYLEARPGWNVAMAALDRMLG